MKKIYSLFAGASLLFSVNASAQCSVSISPSSDTVCAGQTVGLSTTVLGPGSAVTSTFAGGNNHRGNMFTIHALNTVTITSFDAHPMGNTTIEIYYRTGSYIGFETSSAGWTQIGAAAVTAQPFGNPTPVPVAVNITIPAGQDYSFYVTSNNTGVSLNYTDGSSEGAVFSSDANIQFLQGVGMEYPFSNGGGVFRPRVWNGIIHYAVAGSPTYLWSTGATTSSITEPVASSMAYDVAVTVAGCPTLHDTASVFVPTTNVSAGNDTFVCQNMPHTFYGSGVVSYAWDNGVMDGMPFVPVVPQSYVVTGTDSYGCTDNDTVFLMVQPLPVVMAGNDTGICIGESITLAGTGTASSYAWDNSVTDGAAFVPAITNVYHVTGTDVYGCMTMDSVMVTVNALPNTNVTVVNETITLDSAAASYQWMDCSTMQPIAGATSQSFTATVNGSYAVIATNANGCSDTSACQVILSTGLNNEATGIVSLFPNPTEGAFTLSTGNVAAGIVVTDLTGRVLSSFVPQTAVLAISLMNEESGIYFVTVIGKDNSVSTVKVVKH